MMHLSSRKASLRACHPFLVSDPGRIVTYLVCIMLQLLLPTRLIAATPDEMQLKPVKVSPQRRQLIGLTLATVEEKQVVDEIKATGIVEPSERSQVLVQTRFSGWVRKVYANYTYQFVRKGQPMFTVYSPEVVAAENEYLIALKAARQMEQSKVKELVENAHTLIDSSLTRLKLLGLSPREIARLSYERTVQDEVEVDSPTSGYIIEREVKPNMYVQPSDKLYTLADLSVVWVYVAVFQDRIGEVRYGVPAFVTVDSYPGRIFKGRVDFIAPALDTQSRTAKIRCSISNPHELLKVGMYVDVTLKVNLGRGLVIPDSGVLQTGHHNIAFVDKGDGYLQPVDLELGPHVGHEFVVIKGLNPGDKIVSSANFLIDSESELQAALGFFAPPTPESSATTGVASGKIELSTSPNPPRKGDNQIIVKVFDAEGRKITDAQVLITFFMPAMPSMGMPAMRVEALARPVGDGTYTASVRLPMGGMWNITVVAKEGGKEVASAQLNTTVQGGM